METVAPQMDLSEALGSIRFHTSLREPITGFNEHELKLVRLKMMGALIVSALCSQDDPDANTLVDDGYANLKKFYRSSHITGAKFAPDFLADDDYSAIRQCVSRMIPGSSLTEDLSR